MSMQWGKRRGANLDQQNRKWIAGGRRYAACCDQ